MLVDNECIVIIEGSAAADIMSGKVKTELFQKSYAEGFAENSFVRNSSVIQCISPSANDGSEKVKFSVMYKPGVSVIFEQAAVVFSGETEGHYEIHCKNETVSEGECRMSAIRITPSDADGKLELEFAEIGSAAYGKLISDIGKLSSENASAKSDLSQLEQRYAEEQRRNGEISSQIGSINEKIELLRSENQKMDQEMNELSELEAKNNILRKNIDESGYNVEKVCDLRSQLGIFETILDYYKTEEGYCTVSEKLSAVMKELDQISDHISAFADKRSVQTERLTEE